MRRRHEKSIDRNECHIDSSDAASSACWYQSFSKQFVWLSTLPDDTCWSSDSEARPADETASCRWRRAPVFARSKDPQQKPAKRKRMPQTPVERRSSFCGWAILRNAESVQVRTLCSNFFIYHTTNKIKGKAGQDEKTQYIRHEGKCTKEN